MDSLQKHFLEVFYPLLRPAAEHEVDLPGVLDNMRSQLLEVKVCSSLLPANGFVRWLPRFWRCQMLQHFFFFCLLKAVSILHVEHNTQVLGLWGMGGIGKTTLAAKLFNSQLPRFGDAACFLGDVRTEAGHAGGLVKLQQELLKALTGSKVVVKDADSGMLPLKSCA